MTFFVVMTGLFGLISIYNRGKVLILQDRLKAKDKAFKKLDTFVWDTAKLPDYKGRADHPYNSFEVSERWTQYNELVREYVKAGKS